MTDQLPYVENMIVGVPDSVSSCVAVTINEQDGPGSLIVEVKFALLCGDTRESPGVQRGGGS